ncbi:hypothetical protein Fmac_032322 [Flemingia macrophylla]|uniref:ZCF37 n=1 Tax=Flemingia macrophylla TaxID=520843 RepID=A0ABD1L4K0_9FABA
MHTLNPFVCGTFHDEFDEPCLASPGSSPRKYKRKYSRNNNPYSSRGLDKFSALLADLDVKRQKIYSQMNPHEISFVRFVYNHSDDIVPVVVKVRNNKDQKHKSQELKVLRASTFHHTSEEISLDKSTLTDHQNSAEERKKAKADNDHTKVAKKINFSWKMKNPWDVGMPSFYLPMVIVMILLLLTVFGRSVTILFTCIMWYVISMLRSSPPKNLRKSLTMKKEDCVKGSTSRGKNIVTNEGAQKKEFVRGLSEKKMVVSEVSKKEFVRGLSEKKMEVGEGSKKKDLVRWWSEKK